VPFQCLGLPNQVGGIERWAELYSLEDSCPSNTQARPTKLEAQEGGLSRVDWRTRALQCSGPPDQFVGAERWAEPSSLEDSCPSNARAHPTKMEAPSGPGGRVVNVMRHC
jgi:hypothetical protein